MTHKILIDWLRFFCGLDSIMMKSFNFILLHLLNVYFQSVDSQFFHWADCSYDKDTSHVEYICEGENGQRFGRRNSEFLYCKNYELGIDRKTVRKLSFYECRGEQPNMDSFVNLRTYNLSFGGLQRLNTDLMKTHKYLENFIVSNNELTKLPADLFSLTTEIIEIDFSHNKIRAIDPFQFDSIRKLKTIRFSVKKIAELHSRLFSNLFELEFIDFNDNRIETIENNLFSYNKKLKSVNFMNNHITRLDCQFLLALVDVRALNISLNTLVELKTDCANESIHVEMNVTISAINRKKLR